MPLSPGYSSNSKRSLWVFFAAISILAFVRVLLGFIVMPVSFLLPVNLGLGIVYLAAPVLAIYKAAQAPWTRGTAFGFIGGGILVQAAGLVLSQMVFSGRGIPATLAISASQVGLQIWCVGLGALLATSIREKNILIPIAIFLAIFDMFLVLTPVGPTQVIMSHAPKILSNVGYAIPRVASRPHGGVPQVVANVGPADLVFLGAYFVALFRFRMRTRQTVIAMVPTLVIYMFVVLFTGIPLPALLPIGVVTLAINWKEFQLTKDEKLSTGVVALLGLALLAWGFTRARQAQGRPVEPSPTVTAPRGPAPLKKP